MSTFHLTIFQLCTVSLLLLRKCLHHVDRHGEEDGRITLSSDGTQSLEVSQLQSGGRLGDYIGSFFQSFGGVQFSFSSNNLGRRYGVRYVCGTAFRIFLLTELYTHAKSAKLWEKLKNDSKKSALRLRCTLAASTVHEVRRPNYSGAEHLTTQSNACSRDGLM